MFVVNLSYINASNGMFWYAIDKLRSLGTAKADCLILARKALVPLIKRELPDVRLQACTRLDAFRRIVILRIRSGDLLRTVTFTPHPLPFLPNQTVAFYDDYPFRGGLVPRLKRLLFVIGIRSSRSRIGIINRSIAIPFLRDCGIPDSRIFFDRALPAVDVTEVPERTAIPAKRLRIGLVGTDSLKKDYATIFAVVDKLKLADEVRFLIYGADNAYTGQLRYDFPLIDQQVLSSDEINISTFFGKIDYLISASVAEGYGRPMGLAAMFGVPMFLLRSPVFLEFFADYAQFFDGIDDLMRHLVENRPPSSSASLASLSTTRKRSEFFD